MKKIILILGFISVYLGAKSQDTVYIDTLWNIVVPVGYTDTLVGILNVDTTGFEDVYNFAILDFDVDGNVTPFISRNISKRGILTILRQFRDDEIVKRNRVVNRIQRLIDLRNEAVDDRNKITEQIQFYNTWMQTIIQ